MLTMEEGRMSMGTFCSHMELSTPFCCEPKTALKK